MNAPRPFFERLAAADRIHQREAGGRRLLRGVKWLLLALVFGFVADVFLQLGSPPRLLLLLALLVAALGLLACSAWLAFVRRNPVEHTARLLEDRDPTLGSKLINLLQLQTQTTDPQLAPLTRELAKRAVDDYGERLAGAPLEQLARTDTLRLELRNAGLALLAFTLLLGAFYRITRVELARFADPFGDHPPYSFTQLAIVEPGPDGTNVLFGKGFLVKVKSGGHRPKDLFLTVGPPDHPKQAVTLPMLDKGSAGFHQLVDDIRSELVAYAHTKDRHSVSQRVRLGVILVPQLERAFVELTPPAYSGLKAEEKPYAFRGVEALVGSRIRFRLQSNRPLRCGLLEVIAASGGTNRIELTTGGPNEVAGAFEPRESGRLRFHLVDTDGIPSQAGWEGPLTVLHDLPPEIRITEPARDSFVSLDFKVSAQIEANDDYGLSQVRLHRALNGVYSAPKVIRYDSIVRNTRETQLFNLRELGVRAGDVISLFAEATDTSPGAQLARSQTVQLTVISVEDYNEFLRERSDISELQGKYGELLQQLNDLKDAQRQLAAAAGKAQEALAKAEAAGDSPSKESLQRQLDSLLARQHELNAKLNQQAGRMESFVRDNPMYDVEEEFGEALKQLAADIRASTQANESTARDVAQRSSPPGGARALSPQMFADFKRAADAQLARLGEVEEQERETVNEPLADLGRLQALMKDFNQFDALYRTQQSLTDQARAYNRPGGLSREDQLALRDLAATERQVGDLLERLEQQLQEDAKEAENDFPMAAQSGQNLAKSISGLRLQQLAWNATRLMLAGQGDGAFQSADRLRGEMEKLFSEGQPGEGRPGPQELDRYLKLTRTGRGQGMKPGNTFAQMLRSRNFGRPGRPTGKGGQSASGDGESGESGYAVQSQQALDVLGNESFVERGEAGRQNARTGGAGQPGQGTEGVMLDRADVLKGLKPVNRQSGAVQSESLIEEYSDVVEKYFKAITK